MTTMHSAAERWLSEILSPTCNVYMNLLVVTFLMNLLVIKARWIDISQ